MSSLKKILGIILLVALGLGLVFTQPAQAEVCDVDGNGAIDRNDINAIFMARNTPASGPDDPRDADQDGTITVNDGRICVLQCTLLRCEVVTEQNTPPTATITAPPDGSIFGEGETISFAGTATDAEDGDLTSSLSWSSSIDGNIGSGGSFLTVLSVGTHTITALVTDSGGLAGSDSITVTVNPNTPPTVTVIAPPSGSTFTEGTSIRFAGTATDPEDGVLTGSLTWTSSLDGAIGTGGSFSAVLSVGTHTITALVTDSGGLAGSDSITVTVSSNTSPTVTITAPLDGSTFAEGTSISFAGTATDAEDGDLTASLAWTSSLDGAIGTGGSFSAVLSVGNHTITASVKDSIGLTASASITVTVSANTPPTVTITAPTDGSTFTEGASITFSGTAAGIEDGDLTNNLLWTSDLDGNIGSSGSFPAVLSEGTHTITASATDSAGLSASAAITVTVETPGQVPDISAPNSLEFGSVEEQIAVEKEITIKNVGTGPLTVSGATTDDPSFEIVTLTGDVIVQPFTLAPNETRNLRLQFTPPAGTGGKSIIGHLNIASHDPDESVFTVTLSGNVVPPLPTLKDNPILGARVVFDPDPVKPVFDRIDADTCSNVNGEVQFGGSSSGADDFRVILTDQSGQSATSEAFAATAGAGLATFSGIDACALADGVITVEVVLTQDGIDLPPFTGTPAVKNTSSLPAPILDPLPPVTVFPTIEVCGSSRENTTVRIEGGARTVSISLDGSTTRFCLDVPLRLNTQNTLIATAIDDISPPPRPVAAAPPVQIVHVDPSEIVIAEVSSRPLTTEEVEALVQSGVISLDDPSNFNVSMFTVVLTIGSFPVTITQPVAVSKTTGTVSFGGGGGWFSTSGGGGGGFPPKGGYFLAGGSGSSAQIVIIRDESGQTIPGVIIIDGRIKTLKEFFQVTLALLNTSTSFSLTDMEARIIAPPGLTPVRAGLGEVVADVNTQGDIDRVFIGEIGPGETGLGQFIIRGDAIGTHRMDVEFSGFLTGGGLPEAFPVSGSAGTTVQVLGPPELSVVVRHPSDPDGPDVSLDEIYTLIVEVTNLSQVPALYTSLELFIGGNAQLVDENDVPIPDSSEIRGFGHIQPGQTVSASFRVKSLAEGEIIACQAIASENIVLTVDTGPDGTDCNIANTIPTNFEPLPEDMPPTVIGINPLNNQREIPLTTSVVAILTPQSACLIPDTWANVVTAPIDPNDPSKGRQVVSADLVNAGTFYLEGLNPFGEPVRHIPVELVVENPPAGGTTIAVLRLGLGDPLTQFFLSPNTIYRATLVGASTGDGPAGEAVCSSASGVPMETTFQWTFSTVQPCEGIEAPVVTLVRPADGSTDRPLNQQIVLQFTNRMNPASFAFIPGDLAASSFGVYESATESGGDLFNEGSPIPGTGVFNPLLNVLTYTPSENLSEDVTVHVRLTNGLRDVCGNQLHTPLNGVRLFSFQTILPDNTAPDPPAVNPVPALTNEPVIQVTGSAEPGSIVTITGGASPVSTTATASGLFSVPVSLNLDQTNTLQAQATDASGNSSSVVTTDINGAPLVVTQDSSPLQVTSITPSDGATDIPVDTTVSVVFNRPVRPETVNDLNLALVQGDVARPGTFAVADSVVTFTPNEPLDFNVTYRVEIRADGIRDLADNGLSSMFVSSFATRVVPAVGLTCGDLVAGSIDAAGEIDEFTFSAQSGDVVDLTLVRTGGFDSFYGRVPRATVFTPTGAVLAAFNANSQKELTLPESGTYVVRVNANTLVHTGTYDLELECL
ncbi:MAG: Ig-like domain-containing protein [Desulfuromonadales bacterium]|nr:Ig-like domain-containing protein [Desulfuromonadales bacterium]